MDTPVKHRQGPKSLNKSDRFLGCLCSEHGLVAFFCVVFSGRSVGWLVVIQRAGGVEAPFECVCFEDMDPRGFTILRSAQSLLDSKLYGFTTPLSWVLTNHSLRARRRLQAPILWMAAISISHHPRNPGMMVSTTMVSLRGAKWIL